MAASDSIQNVINLLDGAGGNVTGNTVELKFSGIRGLYGVVQVSGFGSATVDLQGRISSDHAWKTVTTFTSDDALEVVLFPQMRGVVSGYGSGTLYLDILGAQRN